VNRYVLGLILAGMVGGAQAGQTVALGFSEHSAQAKYTKDVGSGQIGGAEAGAGLLFNSSGDFLVEASLNVFNEAGTKLPGLVLGLGGKTYLSSWDSREILALAIGGQVNYPIPSYERFVLHLDAYYAPDIVTFRDANAFLELATRAEYELLPQGAAFVEWRRFAARTGGYMEKVDTGLRLGFRIKF